VYNTATRSMEEFQPRTPREVGMYVCGPTVYDDCHVGHARAMVAFDVVVRWLEYRDYRVHYVRNITDIDDKIIKRATERGVSCPELAEQYIRGFHDDMRKLSLREPEAEPRATEHIPEMIDLITSLWEKKLAYQSGGDIYFDVGSFSRYGQLSGRNTEQLLAGARVEVNEQKRNPLDFVLWKAAKEGEPQWPSPWGPGRPGWHIECSAMSTKYLGTTFDIHGGGQDLIFPHHENEIAQSEGATGSSPARYWLHNAHVMIEKTKMSKSLGNFFTLKEVFKKYDPRVVRYFLLSKHYRTPIDFSEGSLSEARASLRRLDECVARAQEAVGRAIESAERCPERFAEAMDEDFNTTEALGVVFGLVSRAHVELDENKSGGAENACRIAADILKCCGVLGMQLVAGEALQVTAAEDALDREELERLLGRESLRQAEIEKLLEARNRFRAQKEFTLADRIRVRVQAMGYEVRDDKGKRSTARKGMGKRS
jgi:cysteinyl-tRNA synthetase